MYDFTRKTEPELNAKLPPNFFITEDMGDQVKEVTPQSNQGSDEKVREKHQISNNEEPFISSFKSLGYKVENFDSEESCSNGSKQDSKPEKHFNTGRWTEEEHQKFLEAILVYGNEWKKVQRCIFTRSSTQARSHAQKFFLRIKKYLKAIEQSSGLTEKLEDGIEENLIKGEDESLRDSVMLRVLLEFTSSMENPETKTKKFFGGLLTSSKVSKIELRKILNMVLKFSSGIDFTKRRRRRNLSVPGDEVDVQEDSSEEGNSNKEVDIIEKKNIFIISKVPKSTRIFGDKSLSIPALNLGSCLNSNTNMQECQLNEYFNINEIIPRRRFQSEDQLCLNLNSFNSCNPPSLFNDQNNLILGVYPVNPPFTQEVNNSSNNTIYDDLKVYFMKKRKSEAKCEMSQESRLPSFHSAHHPSELFQSNEIRENMQFFVPRNQKNINDNLREDPLKNPFALNFEQVLNQSRVKPESKTVPDSRRYPESESMKVEYDDYKYY